MHLKFISPFAMDKSSGAELVDVFTRLSKVDEVRKEISRRFQFKLEETRLICRGKELVDGCTLFEYNVKDGDQVLVSKKVKAIHTDVNCNETSSTPSTSPKSTISEEVSSSSDRSEVLPSDVISKFYDVGDKVDVRCSDTGSWFEAVVVKITEMLNDDDKVETMGEGDGDDLLYHCRYEYFGDMIEVVKLNMLAPRAWRKVAYEDLSVGSKVLVNYNVDVPGELGEWYRAQVVSKSRGRKNGFVTSLLMASGRANNMDNCKITKTDEIYLLEETGESKDREKPSTYIQRVTRKCVHCHDNPSTECRHCKCVVCNDGGDDAKTILCEECDEAYHIYCLTPPLDIVPDDDWFCPQCKIDDSIVVKAGEKNRISKKLAKMPSMKNSETNKRTRNWDQGFACKGLTKKCTKVPRNHIGPIPGVEVGTAWVYRIQVSEEGVHRPPVGGIHGTGKDGAFSIVVSGGYEDDIDYGDEIMYTGSGGRDLSGNKRTANQSMSQVLDRCNLALAKSCACVVNKNGADAGDKWRKGRPIRVCRSYKCHGKFAPERGIRYDGIYKVVKYWPQEGKSDQVVYRFLLRRDDSIPAPWTKEGKKRIEKLGLDKIIEPLKKEPSNKDESADTDEPSTKKSKYALDNDVVALIKKDKVNVKMWHDCLAKCIEGHKAFIDATEEIFECIVCRSLLVSPVTLSCGHSVCKVCLKNSFKADIYNCPTCRFDLGRDFDVVVNNNLDSALKAIFPGYNNN